WYLSYALSNRDIEEMMLERKINVDHSTINRWVIHYSPLLEEEFRKNSKRKTGSSWRMDETYIKVKGVWHYLYRAVDKFGATIDFMLSVKRDKAAATVFFIKAIGSSGMPEKVTIDKSGSNIAALNLINSQLIMLFLFGCAFMNIHVRQIKYLNNIVEQDHRGIKKITKPMMGFKTFHSADATLAGIELCRHSADATLSGIELCRMLRKDQHIHSENSHAFEQFYALAA
ncbi:MAG: IS6 family transposase, partial [Gammaproteobacteria bacterium]|nr:IS6 family transposase [Gammaproteobacteria bacterium]